MKQIERVEYLTHTACWADYETALYVSPDRDMVAIELNHDILIRVKPDVARDIAKELCLAAKEVDQWKRQAVGMK